MYAGVLGGKNIDRNYCLAIVIDRRVFVGRDRYRLNGIHGIVQDYDVLYLFPHFETGVSRKACVHVSGIHIASPFFGRNKK